MEALFLKMLPILFSCLQSVVTLLFASAVKLYVDFRKMKKDLRIAFNKIRELEKRGAGTLEPSKDCDRSGDRPG
jgi:hypothetical protein